MESVIKEIVVRAPLQSVWSALTEVEAIRGWMGAESEVEVDLRPGGRYRLFGGETTGEFRVIDPPHRLAYSWRQGEWPAAWKDSLVEWELRADGSSTRIRLQHSHFPNDEERASHDEGWDLYWLEPMKAWLETQA
jgi:uncharacterized protein YndB with AHSA1/START domain